MCFLGALLCELLSWQASGIREEHVWYNAMPDRLMRYAGARDRPAVDIPLSGRLSPGHVLAPITLKWKTPPMQEIASHRAHMPEGTQGILNARSLHTAHPYLATLLQPGLTVLDVGCGTGAITRDIAVAVGPQGRVVGVDRNTTLIAEARRRHDDVPGLTFAVGDVYHLPFQDTFDLVNAARVLQWLAHPLQALRSMTAAARPGGRLVVLDYNHERITWQPQPPASMQAFYVAFLRWRAEAGMDNTIADQVAGLLDQAGLHTIVALPQPEITQRSAADFATRIGIWAEVAASRGHQMVSDGIVSEAERARAEVEYRAWIQQGAEVQHLYLSAATGIRPHLPPTGC
jgi:SAM-dependent methyltransferase